MPHSVTLNWIASVDAVDGYNLYRGAVKGQETTKINSSLVTGTSFVDTAPVMGTEYYVVRSVAGSQESVPSNEATAVLVPFPPSNLTVVVS